MGSRKCAVNACAGGSEYIIPVAEPCPHVKVQCQRLTQAKPGNPDLA
ncbi:hypothetical protein [Lyngbya confervoides]|uniref:Uncharacterized protein n=1 Tax=Lyngbya confervoides BDU141951 TaxID=1574623 RepID=A0ABD4T4K0_9CYAN|nr:hypothetical protein [Lyngbya confervoides]MCM1983519.1 hypothetical protein [Lyngbya confervoides BDU141951]